MEDALARMELIRGADELRRTTASWRAGCVLRLDHSAIDAPRDTSTVGLVPTMGSLHEGHASLIRRARDEVPRLVVSIFVNPAQFGPGEDLATYPRDEEGDLELCRRLGVDAVWAPSVEEVYPPGVALPEPDPGPVGETFEGAARPGHLHGVLKVVHRLFDVTGPCRAYFGEKDAQQLFLVRRMVEEMEPPRHRRSLSDGARSRRPGAFVEERSARAPRSETRRAACSSRCRRRRRSLAAVRRMRPS